MISKLIKASILILIFIIMLSCATTYRPLTKDIKIEPTSSDSVLFITQNNLDVTVKSTNAGNTGLLGVLVVAAVDAGRQGAANKAATPIMNELENYDFRSVMRETLTAELRKVESINFSDNNTIENIDSKSQKEISYNNAESDAVLFMYVDYELNNNNLIVDATAEIYPKAERLTLFKAKESADPPLGKKSFIYINKFNFVKQAITPENIKQALTEAANNISMQLVADLNNTK